MNLTSKSSSKPDRTVLRKQCQNIVQPPSLYEFMMCKLYIYIYIVLDTSRTCLVSKDNRSTPSADRYSLEKTNFILCWRVTAVLNSRRRSKQSEKKKLKSSQWPNQTEPKTQFIVFNFFPLKEWKMFKEYSTGAKAGNRSVYSLGLSTKLGSSDCIQHTSS